MSVGDLPAANPYPVPTTDGVSIPYPDSDAPAYLVDPFPLANAPIPDRKLVARFHIQMKALIAYSRATIL